MKRWLTVAAVAAVLAAAGWARAEFVNPTDEQVQAAAQEAAKLKDLLKDASQAQASSVLLRAVQAVQTLDLTGEQKKERVGQLFAVVQEALGNDAVVVISDVARRINPELLPTVAAPGAAVVAQPGLPIAQPLAPPVAPPYSGQ